MLTPDQTTGARPEIIALVAQIVSAHVSRNTVPPHELPGLIESVYGSLLKASLGTTTTAVATRDPAVPIKASVKADSVACLECGKKFSMLKRHLLTDHKLTPAEYRTKWSLPITYPMVAPEYAKVRSKLAKQIGLGRISHDPNPKKKAAKR